MHRIHLRGFWEKDHPAPGRVRFTRRFGRPTLSPGQKVFLVLDSPLPAVQVAFNGEPLSLEAGGLRYQSIPLSPRNGLSVEGDGDADSPEPVVVIEIED